MANWNEVQRKADQYKLTRDSRLREEAAALLYSALVEEGQIIARKKMPLWKPRDPKDVGEDAAASILSSKGFTLLLEEHDASKGASLRTYLAQRMDWKIADYSRKEKWYDKPESVPPGPDAPTLTPGEHAVENPDDPTAGAARNDPLRMLEITQFWKFCKENLSPDELDVLQTHLSGYPNEEGAAALGINVNTYRGRLARAKRKIKEFFSDPLREVPALEFPLDEDDADDGVEEAMV